MRIRSAFLVIAITSAISALGESQRILLPVPIDLPFAGGHGSLWSGELLAHNAGPETVSIETSASLCGLGTCPQGRYVLDGGTSAAILSDVPTILFVRANPVSATPEVAMNGRIFDVSRLSTDWGTEIPLVSEHQFSTAPVVLLNVPVVPSFRQTLRIYEWDGGETESVTVRLVDMDTGLEVVTHILTLEPQIGGSVFDFGYLQLDLATLLPTGSAAVRIRLEITAEDAETRLWGFVSVSHNETQRVTLVTPRP